MKAKFTFKFSDGGSFTVVEELYEAGDGHWYPTMWEGEATGEECNDYKLGHPAYGYMEAAMQTDFHPFQTWQVFSETDLVSGSCELVED